MPSLRASLTRSRSAPRALDKQHQQLERRASPFKYAASRFRSVTGKVNGGHTTQARRQPPQKRRRLLNHSSESDDDTDASAAQDSRASTASASEDDGHDSDYVTEEEDEKAADEDDQNSDQPTPRARSRYASVLTMDQEHADDGNTSSSSTSSSPKALSPVEVNVGATRGRRSGIVKAGRTGNTDTLHKRRQQKVRSTLQRNIVPIVTSKITRFPPSPVKLLPANGKRAFSVRPDAASHGNIFDQSAATAASQRSSSTAFKRMAGRFMERVNGSAGITGTGRYSETARVPSRTQISGPYAGLSSSLNGKRKRSSRDVACTQKTDEPFNDANDRRTLRRATTHQTIPQVTHERETDFAAFQPLRRTRSLARQIEQLGLPVSQAYADEDAENEPVASTSKASARGQRQSRTSIAESTDEDTETDSVEKSVADMSLDEITENEDVDKQATEEEELIEEEEEEEAVEDENDADDDESSDLHFLKEASVPQLHRLRKDRLLQLVGLLQHEDDEQDHTEFTKDMLVKLIQDSRESQDDADDSDLEAASAEASTEDDEHHGKHGRSRRSIPQEPLGPNLHPQRRTSGRTSRHVSTSLNAAKQASSHPTSSSPQARHRRDKVARSKSFSHLLDSSSSASCSSSDEDAPPSPCSSPQSSRTRKSASGKDRHPTSPKAALGRGRPPLQTEKTPGRLRSGKLRHPSTAPPSTSDAEKENCYRNPLGRDVDKRSASMMMRRSVSRASLSDDDKQSDHADDDAEVPTPIACRTRHRRNMSVTSATSSAGGYGDDEETSGTNAHTEYRLRKISLPNRGATKRNSIVDVSDDEHEEIYAEEGSDEDEKDEVQDDSIVEHDEDDDSLQDGSDGEPDGDDIDLSSATNTTLLRLRRDTLVEYCEQRDLVATGTKQDLVDRLLEWQSERNKAQEEDVEADEFGSSEDEEDEDFEPNADASMLSASSELDAANETVSSYSSSPARSDSTARRARRETKTQALARLSNKEQSWDGASQDKPLLLKSPQSKAELIHSPKVDTPGPHSRESQDNDLELDLESLNLLDKEIHPDKLKKGEKIGSGGFKDVYEGRYRNVKVALADIRGHLTENDLKELGLLRDLRHDNIVRFIGVSIPTSRDVPVTIVSELCSNGDLFDYVRNTPAPPLEKILSIMLNIARGLEYLHKRKPAIIHRDMKSSNVLITAKGVAKISDFGLARVRNSTRSIIRSLVGTVNWQAPELWVPHPRYNEKVDVYSAGMVFWECLQWHLSQKRYPFEGMNEHAIYQEVGQRQMRPSTATMRRQWGGDILDLVEKMWAQNPQHRPTMLEVVRELELLLQVERTKARAAASR